VEDAARDIALFFYYAFLDDRKALEASGSVYRNLLKQDLRAYSKVQLHSAVVHFTYSYWKRFRNKDRRYFGELPSAALWIPPGGVQLGPWRELLKRSSSQEYPIYLIWIYILGYSEHEVAVGLNTSEGSVRFRVGRALRTLGDLVPAGKSSLRLSYE